MSKDSFPKYHVISLGKPIGFWEASVPSIKGYSRIRRVGVVDVCVVVANGLKGIDQMVWIANERIGRRRKARALEKSLPHWAVLYSGPALNPEDINEPAPDKHMGIWLRRDAVAFDNEGF